ncbi:11S globulin seed storage protein 2-like [Nicotiana tabacum]|uniref:11S globulin seed storage protein 2-like n=2 Tax=Nicotiana TaxID=4085 RepID=A0A1S4B1B1_TOBAC|nr:PREDICTED: 11S globulin seed storage protein 2-like [Nicotiana sylvestris]XP_016482725.1 PREDICTED: 11S globulin seed storage protein 2-like [Nicotiana tabacum]
MAVTTRLLLALLLSAFLLSATNAVRDYQGQQGRQEGQRGTRLTEAQQCRLTRLTASQPTNRIESEGGVTELWDENEEQFQCAGVAPMRNVIRRNSLSLPNFHPMPRLVYIERGQGLIGITYPGCAETFQSQSQTFQAGREPREERGQGRRSDQHQKVHRIRQGDVVALPAGAAHWCYNDGEEELVAVSINDLNHRSNQLDQNLRAFYLAGGVPESGRQQTQAGQRLQSRQRFQNIFRAFDTELMAEAFNIPAEIVRRMQEEQSERGLIVNVREGMRMIRPDEEEGEFEEEQGRPRRGQQWWEEATGNGLEENICTMKIRTNLEHRTQADIFSRQAGKINHVNRHKLPILKYMDMSASRGTLYPNALLTPHWSVNSHCVVYVQRGEAHVQVVDHSGQQVMNDRVNQGEMFVVPQYFASTVRAGQNGLEFVVWRTSSEPMNSQLAGYTSVIRAMPVEVLTNAYQISPNEAQRLKMNRGGESFLLSPQRRSI